MKSFVQAFQVEMLKARRSRVPLFTALGFLLAPFAGAFFMIVLKDPDVARRLGLISTKAHLLAGAADWPTYLELLAQATAIGGIILFSLIATWVFGREYADHTVKDLLALPTPRYVIVLAKFVLILLWSAALTVIITLIGVALGQIVGLKGESSGVLWHGAATIGITAGMTIGLSTPIAFVASAGRGYLAPVAVALLAVVLAQLISAAGWGELYPWAVPPLYAGAAGPGPADLGLVSFVLVGLSSFLGFMATLVWWEFADHL